jgi:hypothetical protein
VEVCKFEPISPHDKGAYTTSQTRPTHSPWWNAPAYKLSQLLTTKIKQFLSLPYAFNVKNTTELIQELKQTPITPPSMFASLDITNSRDFKTRFNEHKRSFIHNKQTSKYALRLLEHSHTLGSMHDVMRGLHLQKKDMYLDTIEGFHIHGQAAVNNHPFHQ